jgi:hypothetical protein
MQPKGGFGPNLDPRREFALPSRWGDESGLCSFEEREYYKSLHPAMQVKFQFREDNDEDRMSTTADCERYCLFHFGKLENTVRAWDFVIPSPSLSERALSVGAPRARFSRAGVIFSALVGARNLLRCPQLWLRCLRNRHIVSPETKFEECVGFRLGHARCLRVGGRSMRSTGHALSPSALAK